MAIAPAPPQIQEMVEKSARAHNVDPLLVQSVIQVESNYNHFAVSPKGAEGLMQLMPGTARMLGVSNSFDPAQNIEAGVKYLRYLQSVYQDDRLALAAYNAGPKAVDRYKGAPPYAETQDYVNQVGQRYQAAKHNEAVKNAAQPAAAPSIREAAEEAAVPAEEEHPKLEQSIDQNGRLVLRTAQE
jgi:soluble lytic murein transglycosylase-like protein